MRRLEARKEDLERSLAEAAEPPPLLHPNLAEAYRAQVADLHTAQSDPSEPARLRAAEAIRSLVDCIVLTPAGGEITIDVHGALADPQCGHRRQGRPRGAAGARPLRSGGIGGAS